MVLDGTLGSWTAREAAGVDATVVLARLVRRALRVGDAVALNDSNWVLKKQNKYETVYTMNSAKGW